MSVTAKAERVSTISPAMLNAEAVHIIGASLVLTLVGRAIALTGPTGLSKLDKKEVGWKVRKGWTKAILLRERPRVIG